MIQLLCAAQGHKMAGIGFKMEYSPGLGKDKGAANAASRKPFFLKKKKKLKNGYITQNIISLMISDVSNGAPGGGGGWEQSQPRLVSLVNPCWGQSGLGSTFQK